MNNLISVVIVNWNGKKWLEKCLSSLDAQTHQNIEVVIVDNGSADDSCAYITSTFPRVKLVESGANLGFAGGNNLGISASSGDFILLLNNDAWLEPDGISQLLLTALQESADIVGAVEVGYSDFEHTYSGKYIIDVLGHPISSDEVGRDDFFYLSGVCLLFKKSFYLESGGLDSDFFMTFEETDWFWRLHATGKKAVLAKNVPVHHAGHGSSSGLANRIDYKRFLWRNQNTLQMLLKNYGAFNLLWVLPLYLLQNIAEALVFVLSGKGQIAKSYLEGWTFNFRMLPETLRKRAQIQSRRVIPDRVVMRSMYWGPAKLRHAMQFLRKKK